MPRLSSERRRGIEAAVAAEREHMVSEALDDVRRAEIAEALTRRSDWVYLIDTLADVRGLDYRKVVVWLSQFGGLDEALDSVTAAARGKTPPVS